MVTREFVIGLERTVDVHRGAVASAARRWTCTPAPGGHRRQNGRRGGLDDELAELLDPNT